MAGPLLAVLPLRVAFASRAAAGALRECMVGCRVVQAACVEDVQAAYATARSWST